MSKIAQLYNHLLSRAQATGDVQKADLRGGARLYVRCEDGAITVSFARKSKNLSDTEIVTFRRHCDVPAAAERLPASGQAERKTTARIDDAEHGPIDVLETWHVVGYRWSTDHATEHTDPT
jgi:hypothetical protein